MWKVHEALELDSALSQGRKLVVCLQRQEQFLAASLQGTVVRSKCQQAVRTYTACDVNGYLTHNRDESCTDNSRQNSCKTLTCILAQTRYDCDSNTSNPLQCILDQQKMQRSGIIALRCHCSERWACTDSIYKCRLLY